MEYRYVNPRFSDVISRITARFLNAMPLPTRIYQSAFLSGLRAPTGCFRLTATVGLIGAGFTWMRAIIFIVMSEEEVYLKSSTNI